MFGIDIKTALEALGFAALGQASIFAGIAFLNKQLLPAWLEPIYQVAPQLWLRGLIALPVFFLIGNIALSCLYRILNPAAAGMLSITAAIAASIIMAMLLEHRMPNLIVCMGGVLVVLGGCLVIYGFKA